MVIGVDGFQEVGAIYSTDCCPPKISEINPCGLMCSFVGLLPNGPLWDRAKSEAMNKFNNKGCNGVDCIPCDDSSCGSLVSYALYAGRFLYEQIMGALAPALKESNPNSAYDTLDDWLSRLGWQDCFDSLCRSKGLGAASPYEFPGPSGPMFCGIPDYPEPLKSSLKLAIVRSLQRASLDAVRNLDNVNWVLEPLGASLSIRTCAPALQFTIDKTSGKIEKAQSGSTGVPEFIDASFNNCKPGGAKNIIWPNVLAAHCIALSLLPPVTCDKVPIVRTC